MKLIIYGIGEFAKLVRYYFEYETEYEVVAYCLDEQYMKNNIFDNLPIVSFDSLENEYSNSFYQIFIAVGYKNMRARKALFESVQKKNYTMASFISKSVLKDPSVQIGENCLVLQGVILEPFCNIEANTFINSGVTVCHHAKVSKHCFIAAKTLIGGYTTIGENSFLGFSSVVLQKLNLSAETLLGAGAVCVSHTTPYSMYIGSPAKYIKSHEETGIRIVDDAH